MVIDSASAPPNKMPVKCIDNQQQKKGIANLKF
jgi:hypothetical protein